jgi:hypothetical protein
MWKLIAWSAALSACEFPRPQDVAPPDDAMVVGKSCTRTTCADSQLEICGTAGTVEHSETCSLGCFPDGSRCYTFVPSNGLGSVLDRSPQEGEISLPSGTVIDSDTGAVTSVQGTPISVTVAQVTQPGGPMLRVLVARTWIIADVQIRGRQALAFVSSGEMIVEGTIDASAEAALGGPGAVTCGSGGGGGGQAQGFFLRAPSGNSGGYPTFLFHSNGLGGAGYATPGGAGGVREPILAVGVGGQVNGNAELVPLRGGCEGGGGLPGYGGGGGGAIQLVSGTSVRFLSGASSKGIVHVGGGRGAAGDLGHISELDMSPISGPGGGGSGGAILIEAPRVVLEPGTALVANGGGGGGYGACDPGPDGADAAPITAPAAGGACPTEVQPSAAGGDGATNGNGETGANAGLVGAGMHGSAGGGGGGLGRVRINTVDGMYSAGATVLVRGIATSGAVARR